MRHITDFYRRSPQIYQKLSKWLKAFILLAFATFCCVVCPNYSMITANSLTNQLEIVLDDNNKDIQAKTHQLPETLAQWQDSSGDYFTEIKPIDELGYLIWSQFPVKVYIQQPENHQLETFEGKSIKTWANLVSAAVQEWSIYLPLEVVAEPEIADITIWRHRPPLRLSETGEIMPARSAETRYELYIQESNNSPDILAHKCIIYLSPTQTGSYIQAAARHELGHGLGIWGHSPVETDVMYASQVRYPPTISPRDVNTLRLVYQQPTDLGWPIDF